MPPDSWPSVAERYAACLARGSDIHAHLPFLREQAHGTVVELGVRDGVSTTALLLGIEEHGGELWSIDHDLACAEVFAGHPGWRFICADSRDVSAVQMAGLLLSIDVLFIDTEHVYEQTMAELHCWMGLMAPDGIVLLHDTESYPAVRVAMERYCTAANLRYRFRSGSNGLGVILMPRYQEPAAPIGLQQVTPIEPGEWTFRTICLTCLGAVLGAANSTNSCSCGRTRLDGVGQVWYQHPQRGTWDPEPSATVLRL